MYLARCVHLFVLYVRIGQWVGGWVRINPNAVRIIKSAPNNGRSLILIHLLPKKTIYSSLPPEGEMFLSIVNVSLVRIKISRHYFFDRVSNLLFHSEINESKQYICPGCFEAEQAPG